MIRPGVPTRTRILAFGNMFSFFYMLATTLSVMRLSFFYIVPNCYKEYDWVIFIHRAALGYIFISFYGNFVTCIYKDSAARRKMKDDRMVTLRNQSLNSVIKTKYLDSHSNLPRHRKKTLNNGMITKRSPTIKQVGASLVTKTCDICKKDVPERSHHCVLCERCIYKRDHHCFFMGQCIGYNNQKYFIYFCLFMGSGTLYGALLIVQYMNFLFDVTFNGPHFFVTVLIDTLFSYLTGEGPNIKFLYLMILMYASLSASVFSYWSLCWQIRIALRGQTTYEYIKRIKTHSKATKLENFKECFGSKWVMSLFIPFIDLVW